MRITSFILVAYGAATMAATVPHLRITTEGRQSVFDIDVTSPEDMTIDAGPPMEEDTSQSMCANDPYGPSGPSNPTAEDPTLGTLAKFGERDRGVLAAAQQSLQKLIVVGTHTTKSQAVAKFYDGKAWQPSQAGFYMLGNEFNISMSVLAMNEDAVISGVSKRGTLLVKSFKNGTTPYPGWDPRSNSWLYTGDPVKGTPTMASLDNVTVSIIVRGDDNFLYHHQLNTNTSTLEDPIQIPKSNGTLMPHAASNGTHIHLAQLNQTGYVQLATWNGKSWSNWYYPANFACSKSPTVVGAEGRIDLLLVDANQNIRRLYNDGSGWSPCWQIVKNAKAITPVEGLVAENGSVWGFYHDTSAVAYVKFGDIGDGEGPIVLGGQVTHAPVANYYGNNYIFLWGAGMNGYLYRKYSADRGKTWQGWESTYGYSIKVDP